MFLKGSSKQIKREMHSNQKYFGRQADCWNAISYTVFTHSGCLHCIIGSGKYSIQKSVFSSYQIPILHLFVFSVMFCNQARSLQCQKGQTPDPSVKGHSEQVYIAAEGTIIHP